MGRSKTTFPLKLILLLSPTRIQELGQETAVIKGAELVNKHLSSKHTVS